MRLRHLLSVAVIAGGGGLFAATSASPGTARTASTTEAVTYTIDGGHSGVLFRIKHLGVSNFYGRFNKVSGSFELDEDDASKCSVKVEIDAASVDSNSTQRDDHIKSPDFLNAKQYPKITFESSKVESKKKGTYSVTGELDFHGTKKEVTIEMQHIGTADTRMGARAGFEGELTIDRREYGVDTYDDATLGGEVKLILAIEGVKEQR